MAHESLHVHQETAQKATLVDRLAQAFNREGIVYSHWKSNIALSQAAAGRMDLDLLVDRRCLPQALTALSQLGYKAAVARWGADPPSIRHYYGLDPEASELVHVHLFSRVLTGESYVKSHVFPFEEMLLENAYYFDRIRVTSKPAELVLFTLRMFVKYGSLLDLISLWRKPDSVRAEVRWLQDGDDLSEALSLLRKHCPVIDEQLFIECVETLDSDSPLLNRMILARKVRRRLKVYAKYSALKRLLAYAQLLWTEVRRRLGTRQKNKVLQAGGAVIAFVGADATGKSTLVTETGHWLGDVFAVRVIHTGKPPSSWLTVPVNVALALVRRLASLQGTNRLGGQASPNDSDWSPHGFRGLSSLPYGLRSVALAWDRLQLTVRARRLAAEGELVICDRYPSTVMGAMDSPRLAEDRLKTGPVAAVYNRLAQLERRLYEQMPPPDIVLKLHVSLETAKRRNRERSKQDGDAYLEARHQQSRGWHMPGTRLVYHIDTEQTIEGTVSSAKRAIWESL
jgi:thymidylate kinase